LLSSRLLTFYKLIFTSTRVSDILLIIISSS